MKSPSKSINGYMSGRSLGGGHYRLSNFGTENRHFLKVYDVNHNQKDVLGHWGCVNTVELNNEESMIASGSDDQRVLLWRVSNAMMDENPTFSVMAKKHISNVFALEFTNDDLVVISGAREGAAIVHDVTTGALLRKYGTPRGMDSNAVYNICSNPIDNNTIAITREEGIMIYDLRENDTGSSAAEYKMRGCTFYSGQYNPAFAPLLAVSSCDTLRGGVSLIDLRAIDKGDVMKGSLREFVQSAMFARWNSTGTGLGVLRSKRSPVFIDLDEKHCVYLEDRTYENIHTMKSLDFIDDNALVVGSDNFNIYVWDIPLKNNDAILEDNEDDDVGDSISMCSSSTDYDGVKSDAKVAVVKSATAILRGHRSIVNHVRYSSKNKMLVSCGVEKVVKCWSAVTIPSSRNNVVPRKVGCFSPPLFAARFGHIGDDDDNDDDDDDEDEDTSVLARGSLLILMPHDNDEDPDTTTEDPDMLRYFDNLILSHRRRNFHIESPHGPHLPSDGDDSSSEDGDVDMDENEDNDELQSSESDNDSDDDENGTLRVSINARFAPTRSPGLDSPNSAVNDDRADPDFEALDEMFEDEERHFSPEAEHPSEGNGPSSVSEADELD